MSPLYPAARRMFDETDVTANGVTVTDFRAHVRSELGPAVRGLGSSVAAGVRGLAQRLSPPEPVDLEPIPEDTFGSGWTPGTGINEEA